jgi:hypothetical protein
VPSCAALFESRSWWPSRPANIRSETTVMANPPIA